MKRFLVFLALLFSAGLARGEDQLVVGLTEDVIHITSSFTGAEFVVYGTIEAPEHSSCRVTVTSDQARCCVFTVPG